MRDLDNLNTRLNAHYDFTNSSADYDLASVGLLLFHNEKELELIFTKRTDSLEFLYSSVYSRETIDDKYIKSSFSTALRALSIKRFTRVCSSSLNRPTR